MESIQSFFQENSDTIWSIAIRIGVVILILIICSIVSRLVKRSIRKHAERKGTDPTLVPIFCTLACIATYVVGLVIALTVLKVEAAGIFAILGAAGIAIGFALKDTLSNIAAGIMLLVLRPFKVGEAVQVGGNAGVVEEVQLFTTSLKSFDGLAITCPNRTVWSGNVINFSRNGSRRIDLAVGISYGDSIDEAIAVLKKIAAEESRFLSDPAPEVMVTAMGESSVDLVLRGWTMNEDFWGVTFDLNKKVKESIEAAGLTIPFPQKDLHIVSHTGPTSL